MKSLEGLRVLNTRPLKQGKALSLAIKKAKGIPIECPALAIAATQLSWLTALPALTKIDYAIFTSANAVEHFFKALMTNAMPSLFWPETIQIIAIGHGSAKALRNYGIRVDFIPEVADSEHLLRLPPLQEVVKKTILLIKGEDGRTLIPETLLERRAQLTICEVYKRIMPEIRTEQFTALWQNDAVDIILFTSQQAMRHIFSAFGQDAHSWLCRLPCLVISERLAREAAALGIQTIITSKPETLLEALHQFKQGLNHG